MLFNHRVHKEGTKGTKDVLKGENFVTLCIPSIRDVTFVVNGFPRKVSLVSKINAHKNTLSSLSTDQYQNT
jgi:hypothetical protein